MAVAPGFLCSATRVTALPLAVAFGVAGSLSAQATAVPPNADQMIKGTGILAHRQLFSGYPPSLSPPSFSPSHYTFSTPSNPVQTGPGRSGWGRKGQKLPPETHSPSVPP